MRLARSPLSNYGKSELSRFSFDRNRLSSLSSAPRYWQKFLRRYWRFLRILASGDRYEGKFCVRKHYFLYRIFCFVKKAAAILRVAFDIGS
jgi:hypothetical protein